MTNPNYETAPTPLPEFITATEPLEKLPELTKAQKETNVVVYDLIFDELMEKVASGQSLRELIEEDPRGLNMVQFMRWLRKDEKRYEVFVEAQAVAADIMVSDMPQIADGQNTLEDVARSQLRISTRKWVAEKYNKKRYGEVKQIDINQTTTINLREILEQRDARVLEVVERVDLIEEDKDEA